MQLLKVAGGPRRVADGRGGGKDRQKPVDVYQFGHAISEKCQAEGNDARGTSLQLKTGRQTLVEEGQGLAGQCAEEHAADRLQDEVVQRPPRERRFRRSALERSSRPSVTNGRAMPSFNPASAVSAKRSSPSSPTPGGPTWTPAASTGSVGARIAPTSAAAPTESPAIHTPAKRFRPIVTGRATPSNSHTDCHGAS